MGLKMLQLEMKNRISNQKRVRGLCLLTFLVSAQSVSHCSYSVDVFIFYFLSLYMYLNMQCNRRIKKLLHSHKPTTYHCGPRWKRLVGGGRVRKVCLFDAGNSNEKACKQTHDYNALEWLFIVNILIQFGLSKVLVSYIHQSGMTDV